MSEATSSNPPDASVPLQGTSIRDLIFLCRPQQWSKNVFVFAPLLFSEAFTQIDLIVRSLIACGCFCLLSSVVYILNDLKDIEADRIHPRKRKRPLAAGRVTPLQAFLLAIMLIGISAVVAWAYLPIGFLLFAGLYLANSIAYCYGLKDRVLLDVILIAIGFVLRLLAGCAAIEVQASSWIMVCGFSLAMVLAFGKRRTELANPDVEIGHRKTLRAYTIPKVDMLLAISTAICLLSYMLYTVAPETLVRHQGKNLIYTIPFVAYGLFRYLLKVQDGSGDGPSEILMQDWIFPLTGLLWVLSVVFILYVF